jgi:hypothetical protein
VTLPETITAVAVPSSLAIDKFSVPPGAVAGAVAVAVATAVAVPPPPHPSKSAAVTANAKLFFIPFHMSCDVKGVTLFAKKSHFFVIT